MDRLITRAPLASPEKMIEVQQILAKPPQDRTRQDLLQLSLLLRKTKFLREYEGTPELNEICRHLKLEIFEPGAVIVKQGDLGSCFYIVLSGKVDIYIESIDPSTKLKRSDHCNVIPEGDSFGELCILYKERRQATAIASE